MSLFRAPRLLLLLPALACSRLSTPAPAPALLAEKLGAEPAAYVAVQESSIAEMERGAGAKHEMGFGNAIEYGTLHPRDSTGWVSAYREPSSIPPVQGLPLVYVKLNPARLLRFTLALPQEQGLIFETGGPEQLVVPHERLSEVLKALKDGADAPIEVYRQSGDGPPRLLFRERLQPSAAAPNP